MACLIKYLSLFLLLPSVQKISSQESNFKAGKVTISWLRWESLPHMSSIRWRITERTICLWRVEPIMFNCRLEARYKKWVLKPIWLVHTKHSHFLATHLFLFSPLILFYHYCNFQWSFFLHHFPFCLQIGFLLNFFYFCFKFGVMLTVFRNGFGYVLWRYL